MTYSFPNLEPVCHSMSCSYCCFLICIQISEKADKVVWISHLLKNFPVCGDPHRDFGVVNKTEVDVFLELLLFWWSNRCWQLDLCFYCLCLNSAWTTGGSQFTSCGDLAWKILSITLLECEMSAIGQWFEHSLSLSFFGLGMKTDFFQFCGHCWVFQICWHNEYSTITASSFRIWSNQLEFHHLR